jgi:sRNA-binding carbon storage regulator CsrA
MSITLTLKYREVLTIGGVDIFVEKYASNQYRIHIMADKSIPVFRKKTISDKLTAKDYDDNERRNANGTITRKPTRSNS